jgi:hypothetical protein
MANGKCQMPNGGGVLASLARVTRHTGAARMARRNNELKHLAFAIWHLAFGIRH